MFKILLQITTDKGLTNWINNITTPDQEGGVSIQTSFTYDEDTETIYTEYEGYKGGEYRQWTNTYTVDEKLRELLVLNINSSITSIKSSLDKITGDKILQKFMNNVANSLRKAAKNYNTNKTVRDRQVIKEQLLRAIVEVEKVFGDDLNPKIGFIRKDIGKIGNPNFRDNEVKINIHKVVEVANKYLKDEPDTYVPFRTGSFLSSNLRDQLAEDFNVAPSTIREHLKRKCEKVNQLFVIKIGY